MTFTEMTQQIYAHNEANGIKQQFSDEHPLEFCIVYDKSNWNIEYPEKSRTYKIRSDNKRFLPNMMGSSLFGDCLDGTDQGVRLDWYDWKIEKIYKA